MHKIIVQDLLELSKEKGFVSEDEIINLICDQGLSLDDLDALCGVLLTTGIIIKNTSLEEYEVVIDKRKTDYDKLFEEVVHKDESLISLIEDVKKIKPAQTNELKNLVFQAKCGNVYARERIIHMNMRVVIRIALWFSNKYGFDLADTIQDGFCGLMIAINKYDSDNHRDFTTYSPWWIRQNIMRDSKTINSLYFPVHYKDKLFIAQEIVSSHECENCFKNEICPELKKIMLDKLACKETELQAIFNHILPSISLNWELENDSNMFDDYGYNEMLMEDKIYLNQLELIVLKFLNLLTDKEKLVINLRFGFILNDPKTLEEVGKTLGLTRERIRQIEAKAIKKVKNHKSQLRI